MRGRVAILGLLVGFLLVVAIDVFAERNYVMGARIDFMAGGSSHPTVNGVDLSQNLRGATSFAALRPHIQMTSTGAHSEFGLIYTFGLNRVNTERDPDSESHVVSALFSTSLGRWKLNLLESHEMTSELMSFRTTQEIAAPPEGFRYLFYSGSTRRSSQSDSASATSEYAIGEKSTLLIGGSYAQRNYSDDAVFSGDLSDQYRASGNINYTRQTSAHSRWGFGYTATYYGFREFDDARSHVINVAYAHQFNPTLTLRLAAGRAHVDALGSRQKLRGYDASLGLQKVIKSGTFSFSLAHNTGESSGIGSISGTNQVGVGVVRRLGKSVTAAVEVTGFESRGKTVESRDARGVSMVGNLGWSLNETWSINWGTQYQRYGGSSLYASEQKRVFLSFRFDSPRLWRFSK